MSGRGRGRGGRNGGRDNINMTAAGLTALINDSVAEALAAAQNVSGQQPCTFKIFMDGKPHTFSGAEGAVGLLRCFVKVESILGLDMANTLPWEEFKTTLREEQCPRDEIQKLEGEFWNLKMEGSDIELYTTRSHEYAVMCPHMVTLAYKRIERYTDGLVPKIQSIVTSSNPTTIQQTI
ncbi:hypothetical protein L1987_27490 [Smallanthus sonchifolius]|uniref:Uncharacterized protein n=1 Tax=Smallanthus sonchifolius TaxID=185202 RepID=A0ACB9IAI3_9ASTR|nr:hypothetical protein L1987_27490 [Smallanthus sonchifolius]